MVFFYVLRHGPWKNRGKLLSSEKRILQLIQKSWAGYGTTQTTPGTIAASGAERYHLI